MPILPTDILPKNILAALRAASNHVAVRPLLVGSCPGRLGGGVSPPANRRRRPERGGGRRRLEQYGPNVVTQEQRYRRLKLLGRACVNPLVILLLLLGGRLAGDRHRPGGRRSC